MFADLRPGGRSRSPAPGTGPGATGTGADVVLDRVSRASRREACRRPPHRPSRSSRAHRGDGSGGSGLRRALRRSGSGYLHRRPVVDGDGGRGAPPRPAGALEARAGWGATRTATDRSGARGRRPAHGAAPCRSAPPRPGAHDPAGRRPGPVLPDRTARTGADAPRRVSAGRSVAVPPPWRCEGAWPDGTSGRADPALHGNADRARIRRWRAAEAGRRRAGLRRPSIGDAIPGVPDPRARGTRVVSSVRTERAAPRMGGSLVVSRRRRTRSAHEGRRGIAVPGHRPGSRRRPSRVSLRPDPGRPAEARRMRRTGPPRRTLKRFRANARHRRRSPPIVRRGAEDRLSGRSGASWPARSIRRSGPPSSGSRCVQELRWLRAGRCPRARRAR